VHVSITRTGAARACCAHVVSARATSGMWESGLPKVVGFVLLGSKVHTVPSVDRANHMATWHWVFCRWPRDPFCNLAKEGSQVWLRNVVSGLGLDWRLPQLLLWSEAHAVGDQKTDRSSRSGT
jgi:hypothetical protein